MDNDATDPIHAILIPETGDCEVIRFEPGQDRLAAIRERLGAEIDLCLCAPPGPVGRTYPGLLNLAVDEWGYKKHELNLNERATWAYGNAPLVGPAIVFPDYEEDGPPHPELDQETLRVLAEGPSELHRSELTTWLSRNPWWRGDAVAKSDAAIAELRGEI